MAVAVNPQAALQQSITILKELERRRLEENFAAFVPEAWKVLHPFEKLVDGWYVDCIAEYLQAVKMGQIRRLIINQPPRTLKSTTTTIMFPCWTWTTAPWWRFIFYSYAFDKLSVPHSIERRRLLQSAWYQERWGSQFELAADENMKWLFSNNKSGRMEVVSQATGSGGKCLIIDDPHSAMQALSDADRSAGVRMVRQGLMTRLDNLETDPVILVMQRLHEKDVAGEFISDGGWTHLCLPAEAEEDTKIFLPVSKVTVNRKKGNLIDPVRLSAKILEGQKKTLGSTGYAGQYQQRPAPAGGAIFHSTWWQWWDPVKVDWRMLVDEVIVTVDTAVKDKDEGSDVAIQAWGLAGIKSYLLERDTEKRNFAATKAAIRAMMNKYGADLLLVEDKSNGPAVMSELKGEFHISAFNPDWGDKTARAQACSPSVEAGDVYLPQNEDGVYIQSVATLFPNVERKDDIDAMTQFLNWRRNRAGSLGWMKAQAERIEKGEEAGKEYTNIPTPKEQIEAAKEEIGMEKKVTTERLKPQSVPTSCKFCGDTEIFATQRGVWCRGPKGCGKRYDL